MGLYPKATTSQDPKWGGQRFKPGYTPVPLDSVAAAKARMLVALEDEKNYDRKGKLKTVYVIHAARNGSDELGTIKAMLAEILAEKDELQKVPTDAQDYAAQVTAKAVHLDATKWVNGMTAKLAAEAVQVVEPIAPIEPPEDAKLP